MNSFNTLPTEMIQHVLSFTSHRDRINVDLTCKRFRDIANKFEDRMEHKYFSCMKVNIKSCRSGLEIFVVLHEKYLHGNATTGKYAITGEQFFDNFRRIKLAKCGAQIMIEYSEPSEFLLDLKSELQQSCKEITLAINCKTDNNIQLLTNNWLQNINTLSISMPTSFSNFAIVHGLKYSKLNKPINLILHSTSSHGSFDDFAWNNFLLVNKFNRLVFKCSEIIDKVDVLQFVLMILEHLEAKNVHEFVLYVDAENFTGTAVNFINSHMNALNYVVTMVNYGDPHLKSFVYTPSDCINDDDILIGSFQLTFKGSFKN